jgi:hypothetical protein
MIIKTNTKKLLQDMYVLTKLQQNSDISNFTSVRRSILHYIAISDGVFAGKYGAGGGDFQDCLNRLESNGKIVCRRTKKETHVSLPIK